MEKEAKGRITVTDGLGCLGRGVGWEGSRILTLRVKARHTRDDIAHHKERVDEMGTKTIQQYSELPPIHHFEYCLENIRPATPNGPVQYGGWELASGSENMTMALGSSSGGPLMTTWFAVITPLRGLLISEERQG